MSVAPHTVNSPAPPHSAHDSTTTFLIPSSFPPPPYLLSHAFSRPFPPSPTPTCPGTPQVIALQEEVRAARREREAVEVSLSKKVWWLVVVVVVAFEVALWCWVWGRRQREVRGCGSEVGQSLKGSSVRWDSCVSAAPCCPLVPSCGA